MSIKVGETTTWLWDWGKDGDEENSNPKEVEMQFVAMNATPDDEGLILLGGRDQRGHYLTVEFDEETLLRMIETIHEWEAKWG